MPNYHENSYRIRSEFAAILKDLSGFRITAAESEAYASIEVVQANSLLHYLSGSYARLPYYSDRRMIDELFNELEKDSVNGQELVKIGLILKEYVHLAKAIDIQHRYYTLMPLIITGFFLLVLCALLLSPHNGFIYTGLAAGFYSISFWIFSIWSSSQNEQALSKLANQLIEKIHVLRSAAATRSARRLTVCTACQPAFISEDDRLPSYEEAVHDVNTAFTAIASTTSFTSLASTRSPFFYNVSSNSSDMSDSLSSTEPLFPQRSYSI
jgi:hypothetical protein